MEAGWAAVYLTAVTLQGGLIWFAVRTYSDKNKLESKNDLLQSEIEHLKEKVSELKEWIRDSK